MSSFIAKILDITPRYRETDTMRTGTNSTASRRIAKTIRERIKRGGERLWRLEDFGGMPSTAVAQALSRLTRQGVLERLSKGVYYRFRQTTFGKSIPNPTAIWELASRRKNVFPS